MTESTELPSPSTLTDLKARIAQIKSQLCCTSDPKQRKHLIDELGKIAERLVEIGWDGT